MTRKGAFYRLDVRLSAVIACIAVFWFMTMIAALALVQEERNSRDMLAQRNRIVSRLQKDKSSLLNDTILSHNEGLKLTLQDILTDIDLRSLRMRTFNNQEILVGTPDERAVEPSGELIRIEYPIDFDGKTYGTLEAVTSAPARLKVSAFLLGLGALSALVTGVIFFVVRSFLTKQVIIPIRKLISEFGNEGLDEEHPVDGFSSFELEQLHGLQLRMKSANEELRRKALEQERQAVLGVMAAQVAHDIRSPLAALDVAVRDLGQFPEDKRLMVRNAVNRIADIANNLIRQNRAQVSGDLAVSEPTLEATSRQLVPSLLEPIVSEKRLQYRSRIGIHIELELGPSSYGIFADIQPVEFKRVISNLINNSVEALPESGHVTVSLSGGEHDFIIKIRDNGSGISPKLLPKLMSRGETHGKQGGSGLGLFHARTSVERWGGNLTLESAVDVGTTIRIALPRALAPSWFVPKIAVCHGQAVIILDDDFAIHQVWRSRFEAVDAKDRGTVRIEHLSTPQELREWINSHPNRSKALYLIDYELLGSPNTGLDLIEELLLQARGILVTSRYEDAKIRERCFRLGVRLIPKSMAGLVPIEVRQSLERPDAVLIDDDLLVHMTWTSSSKRLGKSVLTFARAEEFLAFADRLEPDTPIYVDSNLGEGVRGEEIAKQIHGWGFKTIFLATGYEGDRFPPMPYIRRVVGKEPPWLSANLLTEVH